MRNLAQKLCSCKRSFKCLAESFAEISAIEAECFAKHFVNNTLNLHKGFDDTFANDFPNVAHGHSRIDKHLCGSEEIVLCDSEFDDVDNDVLKQSPSVKCTERNRDKILPLKQMK